MPPSPPKRTTDGPYHFHTYDYAQSQPFAAIAITGVPGTPVLYSLVQDLTGLLLYGDQNQVPNIRLSYLGAPITYAGAPIGADGAMRRTIALSFGPAAGVANAPSVVITGGIHAREWISPEMGYLLAEYLILNYKPGPLQDLNEHEKKIRDLVDHRHIHIIPMLNPAGNWFTVFGKGRPDDKPPRQWRKNRRTLPATGAEWVAALTDEAPPNPNPPFTNLKGPKPGEPEWMPTYYDVPRYPRQNPPYYDTGRRLDPGALGVDLNRNFATAAWGYNCRPEYENCSPTQLTYFGAKRHSEVETLNIEQFLADTAVVASAIDYHANAKCILYPTEASDHGLDDGYKSLGKALRALIRGETARDYQLGTPLEVIDYDAVGTVADYFAQRYHAHAFTIELDPARGDPAGFELPEGQIRMVFEKNIRGALGAIAAAGPATRQLGSATGRAQTSGKAALEFLSWKVTGCGNQLPAQG